MNTQKIIILIVVLLMVLGVALYYYDTHIRLPSAKNKIETLFEDIDLTGKKGEAYETGKSAGHDASLVSGVNNIQMAIHFYFNKYGVLPESLSELHPEFLYQPDIIENIENGNYLYAYIEDRKTLTYHLGVKQEGENSPALESDDDFNSLSAGYTNGFDGMDPIYDVSKAN